MEWSLSGDPSHPLGSLAGKPPDQAKAHSFFVRLLAWTTLQKLLGVLQEDTNSIRLCTDSSTSTSTHHSVRGGSAE